MYQQASLQPLSLLGCSNTIRTLYMMLSKYIGISHFPHPRTETETQFRLIIISQFVRIVNCSSLFFLLHFQNATQHLNIYRNMNSLTPVMCVRPTGCLSLDSSIHPTSQPSIQTRCIHEKRQCCLRWCLWCWSWEMWPNKKPNWRKPDHTMRSHNDDNQLVKLHMEEEGVEDDFIFITIEESWEKSPRLDAEQRPKLLSIDSCSGRQSFGRTSRNAIIHEQSFQFYTSQR